MQYLCVISKPPSSDIITYSCKNRIVFRQVELSHASDSAYFIRHIVEDVRTYVYILLNFPRHPPPFCGVWSNSRFGVVFGTDPVTPCERFLSHHLWGRPSGNIFDLTQLTENPDLKSYYLRIKLQIQFA